MIEAAGNSVVGFHVVAAATDTFTDLYPAFVEKFKTEYGEAPTGGFSALGYDAGITALKAIEAVAKTDADGNLYIGRKALRDALFATSKLHGMTGDINCDQYGDCGTQVYAIWEFTSGALGQLRGGRQPEESLSLMAATPLASGAFADWMRRSTWVDYALLIIRVTVAVSASHWMRDEPPGRSLFGGKLAVLRAVRPDHRGHLRADRARLHDGLRHPAHDQLRACRRDDGRRVRGHVHRQCARTRAGCCRRRRCCSCRSSWPPAWARARSCPSVSSGWPTGRSCMCARSRR